MKSILEKQDYEKLIDSNKKGFFYSFFTISIVMYIIMALVSFIGGGFKEPYFSYLMIICLILSVIYTLGIPSFKKKTYIDIALKRQYLGIQIEYVGNEIDISKFRYRMLCSSIDLSVKGNNILGDILFNENEIMFITFERKQIANDKVIKKFSPLSHCKFSLTNISRPLYLLENKHKIFYFNFPNNVIEISSPTESAYFYVPQAEETIKKLEAIKEELLSEGSSENA